MKAQTKRYTIYLSIGILASLIMIGISYAIFQRAFTQGSTNTLSTLSCVGLTFTDNTDSINLSASYPMNDTEGLASTPFNFTVSNNCNSYVEYQIIATLTTSSNILPKYLKLNLSGAEELLPTQLNTLPTTTTPELTGGPYQSISYVLLKNEFLNQQSHIYDLRIWLDGENEQIWTAGDILPSQSVTIKISIVGTVKTNPWHVFINRPNILTGNCSSNKVGIIWNNKIAGLEITSLVAKETNVNISCNNSGATNLVSTIQSLVTTTGDGVYAESMGGGVTDYRYEGKEPNNYVIFNNELWRVIGVFSDNTHGKTGQSLVKIIRNESIGSLVWQRNNQNDWAHQTISLRVLLNNYYYFGKNEPSIVNCYTYYYDATSNTYGVCDFTRNGITSIEYRDMIENVTWKLGGSLGSNISAATSYADERGSSVSPNRALSVNAYVGLMYPSDYGYSAIGGASFCPRTNLMNYHQDPNCASKAWLLSTSGVEWTLKPNSSSSLLYSVFFMNSDGTVNNGDAAAGSGVRPTIYLKSDVMIIAGDGSKLNPYILTR